MNNTSQSISFVSDSTFIPEKMWWDDIKVESETKDIDCDVLFIENGQPNTMMGDIKRVFEVISSFEGTVIYHHHGSPAFAFPFGDIFAEPTIENPSENNLRVLLKKYDMFKNKKWKILAPVHNIE